MDATHFRQRAARAREMSQSGDDLRISKMLLEVAHDLEAEANAIEAEQAEDRRSSRLRPTEVRGVILHRADDDSAGRPAQVMNLATSNPKLRTDRAPASVIGGLLEESVHSLAE